MLSKLALFSSVFDSKLSIQPTSTSFDYCGNEFTTKIKYPKNREKSENAKSTTRL